MKIINKIRRLLNVNIERQKEIWSQLRTGREREKKRARKSERKKGRKKKNYLKYFLKEI